ncbi:MAG: sigma-54 dependent transcriptional regulator [Gammaproteobacteria bacterium]|nr:sigma-54 dependent transcriptional regulator [Gammaproteobacteria bacterium]MDH4313016.1 sigma-54 dependent transcriptional regulator [Gammaproteobacteria bacterium]
MNVPPDDDAVDLIGESPAFQRVRQLLVRIAGRDASVLVYGTTGTGKEVASRAIHYNSARRSGPFIPVNCGAIPDALLESELFGHRQGAFTDAKRSSPGILSLAHGGTLLLDEIDTLTPKAQVALLRFLQERTIRPVGESREHKVDVRIIAASNRSLELLVAEGRFRQDLFYRLNVMYLELPSLAQRGDDVLLFARHFLKVLALRYGQPVPELDADSTAWLLGHSWPGNIRELENLIERELLLHDGASNLRLSVLERDDAARRSSGTQAQAGRWNYKLAKERVLSEFDRQFLCELMRATRGNVTLAARTSGKERRDLGRLLRKHEIVPDTYRNSGHELR